MKVLIQLDDRVKWGSYCFCIQEGIEYKILYDNRKEYQNEAFPRYYSNYNYFIKLRNLW